MANTSERDLPPDAPDQPTGRGLPRFGAEFSLGPATRSYRSPMSAHASAAGVMPSQYEGEVSDLHEDAQDEDEGAGAGDDDQGEDAGEGSGTGEGAEADGSEVEA